MWVAIAVADITAIGDPLASYSAAISVALANISSNSAMLALNFPVSLSNC